MVSPFILDCDTGRDDALAIWYALAKDLPLCGVVASYGNTPLANVTRNCQKVLAYYPDCSINVTAGADKPLQDHAYFKDVVDPRQKASGNGLCNVELPTQSELTTLIYRDTLGDRILAICALIKEQFLEYGQKLTYVIIGPASNFALICQALGDDISTYIERVVMMGGKFDGLWHDMPWADFNIGADPYAVDIMLRSSVPIYFVPMNATWPICITQEDVESLRPQTDMAEQAQKIMMAHCRLFSPEPVFRFHDPMVMIALGHLDQFKEGYVQLNLDEDASCFGQMQSLGVKASAKAYSVNVFSLNEDIVEDYKAELIEALGFRI
jgi:inosine-uridine nucleoside N-ribohydrolase